MSRASAPAPGPRCASNQTQELVISGYTTGDRTFDALVFGFYDGPSLIYAGEPAKALGLHLARRSESSRDWILINARL